MPGLLPGALAPAGLLEGVGGCKVNGTGIVVGTKGRGGVGKRVVCLKGGLGSLGM